MSDFFIYLYELWNKENITKKHNKLFVEILFFNIVNDLRKIGKIKVTHLLIQMIRWMMSKKFEIGLFLIIFMFLVSTCNHFSLENDQKSFDDGKIDINSDPGLENLSSENICTITPVISPTPALDIGSYQISPKDGMVLLYVPEGEFQMGTFEKYLLLPNGEKILTYKNEEPGHIVFLTDYWIDKTEITNDQYQKCVQENFCSEPSEKIDHNNKQYYGNDVFSNYPVINVNWYQAQDYCLWAGRRLPTEAEWEKAARGIDGRLYPWGNDLPSSDYLNYNKNEVGTTEVGSFPLGSSYYGAMDMAGNVSEWTADWYSEDYYKNSLYKNPTGPTDGEYKVLRGGSWTINALQVRAANRMVWLPSNNFLLNGFRCVVSN